MNDLEMLRYARNVMLSLHKSLLDFERAGYERIHGQLNAGQFLSVLLEDEDFAWLRKFSTLIVEIDEMLELKDGIMDDMLKSNLEKIRDLVSMSDADEHFRSKYRFALQNNSEASSSHAKLLGLMS